MTMDFAPISNATQQAASPQAAEKPEKNAALSSDFETFLTMLTVQMQNQDPLNPIESTDYAVQLATFSGVEQQVRTNDLLASLGTQFAVMGMSQMAGWVGMEAQSSGPAFFDGAPVSLTPKPDAAANAMALVVRDAKDRIVDRQEMPVTSEQIQWNGLRADGKPFQSGAYTFAIESLNDGRLMSTNPVETYSRVVEARNEGGELKLILKGGGTVAAADVTALRSPTR
jgi:flagellar basal-body rod modification protein FlgD